ncbi:MAG: argininosuccinate lyase [Eubacteriales bacterium]
MSKQKMWAGRFEKETDSMVDDFNTSLPFDQRLYREDIGGSIAHASMLAAQGIISQEDEKAIREGLSEILSGLEDKTITLPAQEDIHMAIESLLTEKIGDAGKRLHTGRSRNDQVATDARLYVRDTMDTLVKMLIDLEVVLVKQGKEHLQTVMPGYTHLQRAQPVTFAHHLMAYANMFARDIDRLRDCKKRLNQCPLGAGALATTTYPIDREKTAKALLFDGPMANSLDAVSDRDYMIELLSDLSLIMMHLSRFSEEIIAWCSWEFKFLTLDDGYATGSSIMPQKKNPDVAELVRGKTGRVYGDLMAMLTVMKGLPLAYNKDMQEDKEGLFDAIDTVMMCLPVFTAMVDSWKVEKENMKKAASGGFINATDCADYLVKKGLPFREAYGVVGKLVGLCVAEKTSLENLPLAEYQKAHPLFAEDVYEAIDLMTCVNLRKVEGGPSEEAVQVQIKKIEALIR